MKRLLWARVLRTLFASKVKTVAYQRARRPAVEHLESRLAPATFVWTGAGGAANKNWSAGVNWSGGVAPTPSSTPVDDLVFPQTANNRNTVNDLLVGGAPAAFKSVTLAGSGYTLAPLAAANGIRLGDSTITSGSNIIVNGGATGNTISLNVQFAGAGGSRQFITVGFGADLTVSGKISGSTGVELTKSGVGTLSLSGDNSGFTGPITLDNNGGVVIVGNRLALGTTAQPTRVGTNATLKVNNVTGAIQEPLILNGPGNDNLGALQNLAGANLWSGNITLDSDSTVGGDAGSLELAGHIGDTGAGRSLTKEGLGTIILSSSNTYRGRTTINNGVLTIRDGQALGAANPATDPTGAVSGTFVNHTIAERGTLAIEDTVGNGILVLNEVLTISGQGFPRSAATPGIDPDQGALNNLLGFNQWAGTVYVGDLQPQFTGTAWIGSQNVGTVQQELIISGKILDKPGQTSIFTLQKVGPGKVIFNNKNDYTGATIIREGTLNIRDSGALGPTSGGTATVRDRATLELEVDTGFDPHGRNLGNDSVTGVQNKLDVTKQLILNGVGVVNTGALRSKSGINRVLSQVQLGVQASVAAIGVDPDPHPQSGNNYFTDDYSLTLTGGLADGSAANPTDLEKVLAGQLILPTANSGYHGVTIISQGWVTAMNNASLGGYFSGSGVVNGYPGSFFTVNGYPVSLGQTVQPYVMVESGAALHLKSPTPGGSLTIPQNLILAGNGITHPFGLISGKGALENIEGNNTVTGDIHLSGVAGIGVEKTNTTSPSASSELTLTGSMDDTKSFQIDPDRGARIGTTGEENSHIIDTGAASGTVQIVYNFDESPVTMIPDRLRVYSPPRVFGGSLIYDTGNISGRGVSPVLNYTSSNHLVEIVVDEGGGSAPPPNTWSYQATFTPNLPAPAGGINKFGSKRLIIQGPGTYTGAVDVKEGVLRIQNDTALGASAAGTTVEAGAALEIAGAVAANNGGLAAGIQVWNEQLTLSGPGNSTNGSLIQPLTVLSKDNIWRGGVSLMTDAGVDVKADSRLNILRTIDDANAAGPSGLTKVGAGELALAGTNTYRGVTHINAGVVTVENGLALGVGGPNSGTEVVASATLQLQGDITVPGEPLKIIGTGTGALPTLPVRWFNLGPGAISNGETPGNLTVSGGEVTSVSVDPTDPKVIYLTGGTSGAWKTKDGGKTWTPLIDNILAPNGTLLNVQTMYCGYVVVAPQDPRIIYVGTGQMRSTNSPSTAYGGQGILKSTDGGKTWIAMQGTAANEFYGKAITKIVVDPGANPNIIYATIANAGVPLPGTTAGNNGLWRFNGTTWVNLTAIVSPLRLSQSPPVTVPGPDDDLNHQFFPTDDYTDVVVAVDASFSSNRIIAFAIGSFDGGHASINGTTITYNNGVFLTLQGASGPGGLPAPDYNNDVWRLASYPTTESIDDGAGSVTYPIPGVIKLGISSTNPGFKPSTGYNDPGDYRIYASAAWAERGHDTTGQFPGEYPFFFPNNNGQNHGREGILRSVQRIELNWDPNNFRYNVGGYTGITPPQTLLSTPLVTPHGTFDVGYGNYSQALIVQPGQLNPESGDEANDKLFMAGIGFPYGPGVLESTDGGANWTDISTGADGKGPGAFAHSFGYDGGLLGGTPRVLLATDTGVYRLDNSTIGSIQWTGLNGNLAMSQLNGLDVSPTSVDVAYAGAQNNGAELFSGANPVWRQTDTGSGGQVYVDPKNPNILYHVKAVPVGPGLGLSGSMLRRSIDGGQTWTDILRLDSGTDQWSPLLFDAAGNPRPTINTEIEYEADSPFLVDPINTSRLLVGVKSSVASANGNPVGVALRESVNGGNSFIDLRVPRTQPGGLTLLSMNAVAAASYQGPFAPDPGFPQVIDKGANTYDPDTIYVLAIYRDGGGNLLPRLAVTKNHGVTWLVRPFTVGTTNLDQVQDIFVNPTNRDEVYAVRNNLSGGQQVLKSTDAGRTWDDSITGNLPANLAVWTVLLDPRNNNLYLGTDQGVYKYAKVGAASTWAPYGEGMPNVQVRFLKLNQALNTLTAGTYGRSAFQLFLPDYQVNGGVLRAVAGNSVWTGPVVLTGDATIGAGGTQTLQGGRSVADLTILGEISDATPGANFTLRKTGQGDVVLGGSNTYGGVTIVQQGVLVVTNPHALGSPGNPTLVDNSQFPDTALELQSDLLDEPLTLRGDGIQFNGHFTGVLRNTSNFNKYTGVATLLGDVTIGVDSGSSLTVADTGTLADSGGSFKVTKELTGLLVFQTGNNYGGDTTVNQGILNVQDPMALGRTSGGTIVLDGAQLQIERNAVSLADTTIAGEALRLSGTGIFDTGALLNTVGNNTWRGPVTLAKDPNFSPPTNPPAEVGIGVDRGQDNLTIDGLVGDIGDPLNPVGLRKLRPGRLILTSADSYAGLTEIVAGALRIQDGAGLGTTAAGTLVDAGGALELDDNISTLAEALTLNVGGIGGSGALRNVGGSNVYNGNVTLATNTSIGADAGTQLQVTGVVADPPPPITMTAASLAKVGTGKLIFSGANTYGGNTTISAGILDIRNATGLGLDVGEVQEITLFGSAGTFQVSFNGSPFTDPISLVSPTLAADLQNALNALPTIGGVGGSVTVTRNGGILRVTFGGSLTGQDLPQMIATGAGGTTATVATIRDGTGATTVASGATLQVENNINVSTETLTLNGQGFQGLGALDNLAGNNTWSRPILLASDVFLGADAGSLAINQPIGDAGSGFAVTKVGPGTIDYQAGNTYTGLTQVNDGTLLLDNNSGPSLAGNLAVGDGTGAADTARAIWEFSGQMPAGANAVVRSDGKLDLNGNSQAVASLTITDGDVTTGTAGAGQLTAGALDMTGGNATAATAGGRIVLAGDVTATSDADETATLDGPGQVSLNGTTKTFTVGDGPQATDLLVSAILAGAGSEGLTKTGAGRLELDAANTYAGDTTISAGDVQVDGSIANVKLAGGTLSGNGTVGTVTGAPAAVGTVSPGDNGTSNPYGILHSGSETWGAGTTFFVNLNDADSNPATPPVPGVEHDQLVVNGSLSLGGATLTGSLTGNVRVGDRFTIIQAVGGTVSGRFAEPNGSGVVYIEGRKFAVDYSDPTKVVLTAIITDTTIMASSSANPSVYGQALLFTAKVTGTVSGLPVTTSATVTFTVDAGTPNELSKTKFLDANGQATFDPTEVFPNTPLSVGTHTVTMRFNGNTEFGPSTTTLTPDQTVNQAPTAVTVSTTPNPVFGQSVVVTATVTPVTPVVPTATLPAGMANFVVVNLTTHSSQLLTGTVVNGVATVTLNGLSVNPYSVTVTYLGDTNYVASDPSERDFTVAQANTDTTVTATPASTTFGQSVTFHATVAAHAPGAGTPTGKVTFWDGPANTGTKLGERTLSGGAASLSTAGLSIGLHDITVAYAGDGNFVGSTGVLPQFHVASTATTTRVSASPAAVVFGQPLTVTATVTRNIGAGVPTGSVLFTYPGGSQTVAVNSQGKASARIPSLPVGTQTITADFTGTGDYGDSSGSVDVVVSQARTTTTVSAMLNPTAVGQDAMFTATVRSQAPGAGIPMTGQVLFFVDTNPTGIPADVDANGVATVTISGLALGSHTVKAQYQGSGDYFASLSAPYTQRVVANATTTTLAQTLDTTSYGQNVGLTATVRGPGDSIVRLGTVRFYIDGLPYGSPVPLTVFGRAALNIKTLPAGVHTFAAVYSGTTTLGPANDFAASKDSVTHTINKADTMTGLTVTPSLPRLGQAITFTATVASKVAGGFVPQGSVTFTIDGVAQAPVLLGANGTASITRNNLALGDHTVSVAYNGNGNNNVSDSGRRTVTVNPPLPATHLLASVTPNPVGVLLPFTLAVSARDVLNGIAGTDNDPVRVVLTQAPPGGLLLGNLSSSFTNGIAVFTNLRVTVGGRYRVRIISGNLFVDFDIVTFGRQT